MESEKTTNAKKAVAEKVEQAHKHVQEQVKTLKQSRIGKMVPLEFQKVTTEHLALGMVALSIILELNFYMYCKILSKAGLKGSTFPWSFVGILYLLTILAATAHDIYAFFAKNSRVVLSFLVLRVLVLGTSTLAILRTESHMAGFPFKLVLFLTTHVVLLVYTYVLTMFVTQEKSDAKGTGDQEAV